jgi:large repetitive protein
VPVGGLDSFYLPDSTFEGNKYYRVIVNATGNGCGVDTSVATTVTLTKDLEITAQPNAIVQCSGGRDSLKVQVSNGVGTISYQWQSSTTGNDGTFANISGATQSFYIPTDDTPATTWYQVVISATGNGCGAITSTSTTVQVVRDVEIQTITNDLTLCQNATDNITVVGQNGTGAYNYRWETTLDTNAAWTPLATTGATQTVDASAVGMRYYRVWVGADGVGCGPVPSRIVKVDVKQPLQVTDPADITACLGNSGVMVVTASGGTGTYTYKWQSSTTSPTAGFTDLANSNSPSYLPDSTTLTTTYYRVIVSDSGTGCGADTSAAATVRLSPDMSIAMSVNEITECLGGNERITAVVSNGVGTKSYQWQVSTTNAQGSFTNISGATDSFYIPSSTAAEQAVRYYRVIVTATGNGCGAAESSATQVTILDELTVAITSDLVLCKDGTETITATPTGGTGAYTYRWEIADNASGPWRDTTGTTANLNPKTSEVSIRYYRALVKAAGSGCDEVPSTPVRVEVIEKLAINQPANIVQCVGGGRTLTITTTGGTGTPTYRWFISTDGGTIYNPIATATSATYTPDDNNPGITLYRVEVNSPGNGCGSQTSLPITVEVIPDISIPNPLVSQIECVGGDLSWTVVATGGIDPKSYQWEVSNDSLTGFVPVTATDGTGGTTATFTPNSSLPGNKFYRVVVSSTGFGCGSQTSTSARMTVIAKPVIVSVEGNATQCEGGQGLELKATVTGGVDCIIQWQSKALAAPVTDFIDVTPNGTGPTYITPVLNNSTQYRAVFKCNGNGCCN